MLHQTPTADHRPSFQIELPLDPATDNSEHVAQVLDRLFGVLDDIRVRLEVSEPDMVQALTIATAVRATMAEMNATAERGTVPRLLDIAVQ
jgi:hypothetical protein